MESLLNSNDTRAADDRLSVAVLQRSAVAGLFGLFYGPIIPGLVNDWYEHSIFSYGFLVPVIAGYLIWQRRDQLRVIPISARLEAAVALLTAVMLGLLGQAIGDSFAMRVSMILAMGSTIWLILGSEFLKAILFPLSYLALMIPLPYVLVKEIMRYLIELDATHAERILKILGLPIYRDTFFLHLPNITLEVAEVCSGISSVFALFALGLIYAYFLPLSKLGKIVLLASTVPLAILVNLFRIVVTVILTYYFGPVVLESLFHRLYGTFNFLLSLGLLLTFAKVLRRSLAVESTRNASTVYWNRESSLVRSGRGSERIALSVAAIVFGAAILASESLHSNSKQILPAALENLPLALGSYTAQDITWPDPYSDPKAEKSLARVYARAGGVPVELFIGYNGNDAQGRLQSPRLILPEKWSMIWTKSLRPGWPAGKELDVESILTQRGGSKRLVFYWYQIGGRAFIGELRYRTELLKARIFEKRSDMAVIRIATILLDSEDVSAAQARLSDFGMHLYPQLVKCLPM